MTKVGDLVIHHAYGTGIVLDRQKTKTEPIVFVKWDNPELGRFPEDILPWEYESFWTNECDLLPDESGSGNKPVLKHCMLMDA